MVSRVATVRKSSLLPSPAALHGGGYVKHIEAFRDHDGVYEYVSAGDTLEDFKSAGGALKAVFASLELFFRLRVVQELEGELAAHDSGALKFVGDGGG